MARGSTEGLRRVASSETRQDNPVWSRSLGEPSAETLTSKAGPAEEALERRTRRSHGERPCGSPDAIGLFLPVSLFSLRASGTLRGVIADANCVGGTGFFGRSRLRAGGAIDHVRCWHRRTVYTEVVVRHG